MGLVTGDDVFGACHFISTTPSLPTQRCEVGEFCELCLLLSKHCNGLDSCLCLQLTPTDPCLYKTALLTVIRDTL